MLGLLHLIKKVNVINSKQFRAYHFKMVLCSILNTTIILPIFATVMIRRNGMEFLSLHRKQIKKGIESTRNLFDTVLFWGRYFVAVDIL